ncbi:hypothetical protein RCL1_000729 [Eukaryota sp. TZLM3-RCL]
MNTISPDHALFNHSSSFVFSTGNRASLCLLCIENILKDHCNHSTLSSLFLRLSEACQYCPIEKRSMLASFVVSQIENVLVFDSVDLLASYFQLLSCINFVVDGEVFLPLLSLPSKLPNPSLSILLCLSYNIVSLHPQFHVHLFNEPLSNQLYIILQQTINLLVASPFNQAYAERMFEIFALPFEPRHDTSPVQIDFILTFLIAQKFSSLMMWLLSNCPLQTVKLLVLIVNTNTEFLTSWIKCDPSVVEPCCLFFIDFLKNVNTKSSPSENIIAQVCLLFNFIVTELTEYIQSVVSNQLVMTLYNLIHDLSTNLPTSVVLSDLESCLELFHVLVNNKDVTQSLNATGTVFLTRAICMVLSVSSCPDVLLTLVATHCKLSDCSSFLANECLTLLTSTDLYLKLHPIGLARFLDLLHVLLQRLESTRQYSCHFEALVSHTCSILGFENLRLSGELLLVGPLVELAPSLAQFVQYSSFFSLEYLSNRYLSSVLPLLSVDNIPVQPLLIGIQGFITHFWVEKQDFDLLNSVVANVLGSNGDSECVENFLVNVSFLVLQLPHSLKDSCSQISVFSLLFLLGINAQYFATHLDHAQSQMSALMTRLNTFDQSVKVLILVYSAFCVCHGFSNSLSQSLIQEVKVLPDCTILLGSNLFSIANSHNDKLHLSSLILELNLLEFSKSKSLLVSQVLQEVLEVIMEGGSRSITSRFIQVLLTIGLDKISSEKLSEFLCKVIPSWLSSGKSDVTNSFLIFCVNSLPLINIDKVMPAFIVNSSYLVNFIEFNNPHSMLLLGSLLTFERCVCRDDTVLRYCKPHLNNWLVSLLQSSALVLSNFTSNSSPSIVVQTNFLSLCVLVFSTLCHSKSTEIEITSSTIVELIQNLVEILSFLDEILHSVQLILIQNTLLSLLNFITDVPSSIMVHLSPILTHFTCSSVGVIALHSVSIILKLISKFPTQIYYFTPFLFLTKDLLAKKSLLPDTVQLRLAVAFDYCVDSCFDEKAIKYYYENFIKHTQVHSHSLLQSIRLFTDQFKDKMDPLALEFAHTILSSSSSTNNFSYHNMPFGDVLIPFCESFMDPYLE